jgi:capsular exopolysaccharide synthesis family protein
MDGIVPFRGNPSPSTGLGVTHGTTRPTAVPPHALPAFPPNPAAVKTPADYLRALRRRVWLVLAVAVPMAIASSTWALRQPRIYQALAEVTIDPPQINPMLSTLVSRDLGQQSAHSQETYLPNLVAMLRTRRLAEDVVGNPAFASEVRRYDDAAYELILKGLQVRPYPKTNMILVTLEGRDPALTKKLLEELLRVFKNRARQESDQHVYETKDYAKRRLGEMRKSLETLEQVILDHLKANPTIGPGGKNIFEDQYINSENMLAHKQMRIGELSQQLMVAQSFPHADFRGDGGSREQRIALLETEKRKWIRGLQNVRRVARNFNNDPAAVRYSERLQEIMDELEELKSLDTMKTQMAESPLAMILDRYSREFEGDRARHEQILAKMQESMPAHQKFLSLIDERDRGRQAVAEMGRNIDSFEILAESQKAPVKGGDSVIEPTVPVRPSRVLLIGMGLIVSFGLGIGLVCLLEHIDHSVKVPEHVTQGLTLPLLGVVPRIRRTALTHRAGHLWTPGDPDSVEADAFRNIRASLLGITDRRGPIVTLLVTSPKAGDGKSTAALNLAATCARAGERTLLVDVDLRRPSLGDVFLPEPDKEGTRFGLVDVLKGTLPWQKTLRHTDHQNLDFMATGDPRGIPIEILGTLELRQLLNALSEHYDRVILDGPAVLGMADCRVLGRMVDASVLVVRAGSHPLVTLQRAKAMLEQSHVALAGVIVNGLSEGVQNWSSYGYESSSASIAWRDRRALETSDREEEAMALA